MIDDEMYPYSGNLPWLRENTILLVTHGSHAYGLNTPTSDIDLKGVAIPPKAYFLGFQQRFEQAESKDPYDMVVYEIRKFFNLAAECNPNIIEVLWADESTFRVLTPLGRRMVEARERFLSRKARFTFSGYAHAQLKRIQLHHRWLRNPPTHQPTRGEFSLPERTLIPADQLAAAHASIQKKLDTWNLDDLSGVDPATRLAIQSAMATQLAEIQLSAGDLWKNAARSLGQDENFILLLDRERQYNARQREWEQYQSWKTNRNPKRAELEAKYGYDSKHGMHLVRLMRMCREIMDTGKVNVKRSDREELLAIRNGAWSYEQLLAWAEATENEMDALYRASTLPHAPDRKALDALCVELVEASLRGER
jgi:predicted nucleotidyltransferase